MVVYDGGDHADAVLKTTSWLEHSGIFKVNVLAVTDKETLLEQEDHISMAKNQDRTHGEHNRIVKGLEKEEFLANIGIEYNRIILNLQSRFEFLS